jgi:hypothetical protein
MPPSGVKIAHLAFFALQANYHMLLA